ncbi:class I SAM-dependent methyltransferase [Halorhodospira halochloris]|uniref:class I SAM-dependent methyltransferase n=1 Tax=Halorhodospira halochloris TaxID=1052 RepID=UPI001EE89FC7|nr:class I SAM-dependent methyltransferase [Halorhodospira halochloris]MCG5548167.1 class I SAM-dependent methyltransferase [Halorhodospira halochloris]
MHLADADDSRIDTGLLGVRAASAEKRDLAAQWAGQLGAQLLTGRPDDHGVVLIADQPAGLELITTQGRPKPVTVDFTAAQILRRLKGIAVRRDPLVKAIGLHRRRDLTVVDATAGLGRDGLVLAWLGAEVRWIESSPTLALMLNQAIELARDSALGGQERLREAVDRLKLLFGQAESILPSLSQADVVYLDPMYPLSSMRGGVGKEAQTLQALIGKPSPSGEELLIPRALSCAKQRVAVKRPLRASPLAGHRPTRHIAGKSIRFDIYE